MKTIRITCCEADKEKESWLLDEVTRLTERSHTITGIVVGTFAAMEQSPSLSA